MSAGIRVVVPLTGLLSGGSFLRLFLFGGKGGQHGFGNKDDAAFADAETLFVQLGINADLHAIRNGAIAVNDAAAGNAVLKQAYKAASDKKTFVWTKEAFKEKSAKFFSIVSKFVNSSSLFFKISLFFSILSVIT